MYPDRVAVVVELFSFVLFCKLVKIIRTSYCNNNNNDDEKKKEFLNL